VKTHDPQAAKPIKTSSSCGYAKKGSKKGQNRNVIEKTLTKW
jgi:hypothetical protein